MSRKFSTSSRSKSTDIADVSVRKDVRRTKKTLSKNLKNIDKVEDRKESIAIAAYYKAEKRGFKSGGETQDWLEAEAAIDRHHNVND